MAVRRNFCLSLRERSLELGQRTVLMGIVNITPDSFSGDGQSKRTVSQIVRSALGMVRAGAGILDIGGESTRPGARAVGLREEIRRVVPVIQELALRTDAFLSVDSSKPQVAQAALEAGASIVNVIQGTPVDGALLEVVRRFDAGIILMHMRGTPQTMQTMTSYRDLLKEVCEALEKSVEKCLGAGIKRTSIVVDPGIGFAKSAEQNLLLIKELSCLRKIGCPILLGPSRKSFIGKVLDCPVDERLMGTAATVSAGIFNGAHILRVHDVLQMSQVVRVTDAILNAKS